LLKDWIYSVIWYSADEDACNSQVCTNLQVHHLVMKLRNFFIAALAVVTTSSSLIAQQISSALETHYKKYPQEKIYIQTDKQVYSTGQTIWYKVYATAYGTPATLSKIVHVQLINSNGRIILHEKLPLVNGTANGNIEVPANLPTDYYQLRSFTAWMLNFDERGLFHKIIYFKNLTDTIRHQGGSKPGEKTYYFQFFPEGGDLVNNITANIAFKATDQNGLPAEAYGEIFDETNTLIDSIKTYHDGMGLFILRPETNRRYYAIVHFPDRSERQIPLPPANQSGIGIRIIEQKPEALHIEVIYHEARPGQYKNVLLAASQQSGKVATFPLQLSRGINIFNFNIKGFVTGILRLTFLDANNLPLAERVVFVHNSDNLELHLQKDTISFDPKAKSALTFQLNGIDSKINQANLSVSVTDADDVLDDHTANIYSSLLLTSEVKGHIYNPCYYFTSNDDSVREALDLVMLTNGWRHFEWTKIINGDSVALKYPAEDSLFIAGQIIGYKPNEKREHVFKIIIHQQDSIRFIGFVAPDLTGRFILKDYAVPGLSTVYYQDQRTKAKSYHIRFYDDPMDTLRNVPGFEVASRDGRTDTIGKFMKSVWDREESFYFTHKKGDLKPVFIKGFAPDKSELLAKRYISQAFSEGRGNNIDLVNNFYSSALRLFDFLKGRFPGLIISGSSDNPGFSYRNSELNEIASVNASTNGVSDAFLVKGYGKGGASFDGPAVRTSEPYVFLNEVPSSIPAVRDIPLSEIALIRFIPPPSSLAPMNGGVVGVLAIYLKKEIDSARSVDFAHNYDHYTFEGYSLTRKFYSPDYSAKDSTFFMPDNRETLYWNSQLQTDSDNKIHFSFFNSDHAKKFRIIAEGMDEQGRLISINQIIEGN